MAAVIDVDRLSSAKTCEPGLAALLQLLRNSWMLCTLSLRLLLCEVSRGLGREVKDMLRVCLMTFVHLPLIKLNSVCIVCLFSCTTVMELAL